MVVVPNLKTRFVCDIKQQMSQYVKQSLVLALNIYVYMSIGGNLYIANIYIWYIFISYMNKSIV